MTRLLLYPAKQARTDGETASRCHLHSTMKTSTIHFRYHCIHTRPGWISTYLSGAYRASVSRSMKRCGQRLPLASRMNRLYPSFDCNQKPNQGCFLSLAFHSLLHHIKRPTSDLCCCLGNTAEAGRISRYYRTLSVLPRQ